jgi:hypothetical protein
MAENPTLNPVTTFVNDTAAVNLVNNNYTAISTAFTDCLSRSGTSPNTMTSNLDMNSNAILNLPAPVSPTAPVRVIDVAGNPTITVPPIGTSGATVPLLNANNTFSGTNTFSANNTFAGTQSFVNEAVSGNTTIGGTLGVTGVATFTAAPIIPATTILHGNQLVGTTTNDNATIGNVGEYVASSILFGSGISLSTTVTSQITSISLTAGDWDIWGNLYFGGTATTNPTVLGGTVSTTSAQAPGTGLTPGTFAIIGTAGQTVFNTGTGGFSMVIGPLRVSLSTTTTYYLNARADFTTSTSSAFGLLAARRVR